MLNHHINQTLAGRIALTTLLPLSLSEISQQQTLDNIDQMIFKGFYPTIISEYEAPEHWIQNYIHTYVERDVRNIKQITDLSLFQKFLKLCAGRIGQILDLTSLGNDCGITSNAVKSWLSILESTYLIFLVYPHHKNFSKRLIKSPKLFFYDTAIACQLLSIENPKQLQTHYLRGNLFESLILSDIIKEKYNRGKTSNLYFWRDKMGLEIDGILEKGSSITAIEIRSSETISADFFSNLVKWNNLPENTEYTNYVIYAGSEDQERSQGTILSWSNLSKLYNRLFTN